MVANSRHRNIRRAKINMINSSTVEVTGQHQLNSTIGDTEHLRVRSAKGTSAIRKAALYLPAALVLALAAVVESFIVVSDLGSNERLGVTTLAVTQRHKASFVVGVDYFGECGVTPESLFNVHNNDNQIGSWTNTGDPCVQILDISINAEEDDVLHFDTKPGSNAALKLVSIGIHAGKVRSLSGANVNAPGTQGKFEKQINSVGRSGSASFTLSRDDEGALPILGAISDYIALGVEPGFGVKSALAQNKDSISRS
jgi:hypothetical protein